MQSYGVLVDELWLPLFSCSVFIPSLKVAMIRAWRFLTLLYLGPIGTPRLEQATSLMLRLTDETVVPF